MKEQAKKRFSEWPKYKTLDYFIKLACIRALKFFNGNQTHASQALGISIRTMRIYKKKYNLSEYTQHDKEWSKKVEKFKKEYSL